jgi:hypothetical protein
VSCCWAIAATSPASLRLSRATTAGSRSMQPVFHPSQSGPVAQSEGKELPPSGRATGGTALEFLQSAHRAHRRSLPCRKVATPPKPMATPNGARALHAGAVWGSRTDPCPQPVARSMPTWNTVCPHPGTTRRRCGAQRAPNPEILDDVVERHVPHRWWWAAG